MITFTFDDSPFTKVDGGYLDVCGYTAYGGRARASFSVETVSDD